MVVLNTSGEEINAKIVYYGPGVSGKTTNLEYIHEKMPVRTKGKLVSMKTRTDRTLFFDFLPLELGEINGYRTRFLLYTVPGQVYYNATRKLVLNGADAVVFVADSSRAKLQENIESLRNLEDNLNEHGMSLDHLPWVIQYNKRDLPDAMPVEELHEQLNLLGVPAFEAVAVSGRGVYETFQGIAALLYDVLKRRLEKAGDEVPLAPSGGAVTQEVAVAVDSALREVASTPAPAVSEVPQYQTVAAPSAVAAAPAPAPPRAQAPAPAPTPVAVHAPATATPPATTQQTQRAQSVGSPVDAGRTGVAGQPAASAPKSAPAKREAAAEDESFGFEKLPAHPDSSDDGSTRRVDEAQAASEAARDDAMPDFIIDPMGRKPREKKAAPPTTPVLPERRRVEEQHTVELTDVHEPKAKHIDDVAVPEARDAASITVPVTLSAAQLQPGRPLRIMLDIRITDD